MFENRFKNKLMESRSYPRKDSDHNLVMMKCELKFERIMGRKKKIVQLQIKNLKDKKQ